jgi:hypothetical protein
LIATGAKLDEVRARLVELAKPIAAARDRGDPKGVIAAGLEGVREYERARAAIWTRLEPLMQHDTSP